MVMKLLAGMLMLLVLKSLLGTVLSAKDGAQTPEPANDHPDLPPPVLYTAWTFTGDPRNEHGFSFRISAPTKAEALALGDRMVLTTFPEYEMTHSSLQSLEEAERSAGRRLHDLLFLSAEMSEAELCRRMTTYRHKRDAIPPAARAY